MNSSNKHLIKLWIITLLLAPFVYAVYELVVGVDGQVVTLLEVLPITLIFSIAFSLPTLLIAFLVNKLNSVQFFSFRVRKLINVIVAAIGLIITLLIIRGSLIPTLIKTYLISLGIAAIIMELVFQPRVIKKN